MSGWRSLESPRLGVPLELREVTPPGLDDRVWEVQELRQGCVFKLTLTSHTLRGTRVGAASSRRELTEAEIERAVCLAVEGALVSPPEKELGVTYEVDVSSQHLREAGGMSG
jgi:hypothetical protein